MKWKREYELGIPVIDTQHKQLFRFGTELEDALKRGLKVSSITDLLINVKQYTARHFYIEEKYMDDISYPELPKQKEAHTAFVIRFSEIQEKFDKEGISPALVDMIRNELISWIDSHITGMDQEFGDYYRNNSTASS